MNCEHVVVVALYVFLFSLLAFVMGNCSVIFAKNNRVSKHPFDKNGVENSTGSSNDISYIPADRTAAEEYVNEAYECFNDDDDSDDHDSLWDPNLTIEPPCAGTESKMLRSVSMIEIDPVTTKRIAQLKSAISNLKLEVEFTKLAITKLCLMAKLGKDYTGIDHRSLCSLEYMRMDIQKDGCVFRAVLDNLLHKLNNNEFEVSAPSPLASTPVNKNDD